MDIELGPGVTRLLHAHGERAVTVELTIDFELDARKSAVAFPGPSDASLGYQRVAKGGIDVWWRQRLVFASREPKLSDRPRPRRLRITTTGRALLARADYCTV